MNIFNSITLFGGLAMFLYGMRLMGDGLKESSSGTLKKFMEKVTGTPVKAFLLGLIMTAVIQSSTATIVITSGLVGAGIISLHQSLGIVVGANVGTTVTGQIIRLLDIDGGGMSLLQFFKPSTLAPLALIAGIIIIMGKKFKGSDTLGQIMIGFGILFSGLLNMTDAVSSLTETGIIESLFSRLGENPVIGYLVGLGVAFVLQSSSATIGILQAFSTSGQLLFNGIYSVLMGVYLGDCVTTAIVINIGAKPEAKRVGYMNILYNLGKTALILVAVTVAHKLGWLDSLWNSVVRSGDIADTNTVFNLASAILLFPMLTVFEKLSYKLVKDEPVEQSKYAELLEGLSPVFFSTPALAFGRCYDIMQVMYELARENLNRGFEVLGSYDHKVAQQINEDENNLDMLTDRVSNYLFQLSGHISSADHVEILNHYYSVITEFERLGDRATNMCEIAQTMNKEDMAFSDYAMHELNVLRTLIDTILEHTELAFKQRNVVSARHIEPLEEVVDDMVNAMKENHMKRLREGKCSVITGTAFLNLLSEIERVSDICSNVGVATVARATPDMQHQTHDYVTMLHSGRDETFNREYREAHDRYFRLLVKE